MDILINTNPDIVLLNETKLNKNHKIEFKYYNIIRRDRTDAIQGSGAAILVKRNTCSTYDNLPALSTSKYLETTIIEIKLRRKSNLYIIATYAEGNNFQELQKEFHN